MVREPGYNLYTPAHPAVAYAFTANRYLVVWDETWHPMPIQQSIRGQVLSSTGGLVGTRFDISSDPGDSSYRQYPALAYNRARNEYLVAWQQRNPVGKDLNIFARRVTGNGHPLQPESIELSGPWANDQKAPAVAALPNACSDGQYLVVWEDRYPGDVGHTTARRVDGTGSPNGSSFYVGTLAAYAKDQTNPTVTASEHNRTYLVAWSQPEKDPLTPWVTWHFIFARAISVEGDLISPQVHAGGRYNAHRVAMASGFRGDILLTFDDDPVANGNVDIYGRLWGNRVYAPLLLKGRR